MIPARDNRAAAAAIAANLEAFLAQSPLTVSCRVYLAQPLTVETVQEGNADIVGSVEVVERRVDYSPAITTPGYIIPPESELILTYFGEMIAGDTENPVFVLTGRPTIPVQSVIEYDEFVGMGDDDIMTVTLYVLRSKSVGLAPGAVHIHACLPMSEFMTTP